MYTKFARAIKNAKAHEISTGKLNEFVNRFNRVTAPYELAAKHIQKIGTMVGAHFGSLGAIAGADIGARLASKARLAGGAGAADAADKLIASPAFQSAVKIYTEKRLGTLLIHVSGAPLNGRVFLTLFLNRKNGPSPDWASLLGYLMIQIMTSEWPRMASIFIL